MPNRPPERETETGWTDWLHPAGDEEGVYQLQCCDCGLVHDMQFIVAIDGEPVSEGYNKFTTSRSKRYIPIFRARRNNRATAQTRRRQREKNNVS